MRRKNVNEANVADNVSEDDADIRNGMLYSVEDTPPWYLCILLGFQHYLTAVGALISVPILLSSHFCMDRDKVGLSELIGTIFFVSGLATLLQTTFGVRLPIVQGGTFSFVAPTIAIMAQWGCPYTEARDKYGESVNFTALGLPEVGSEEHRDIWMERIREIQGAIIVSSVFQVVIGFSGLMGFVLRFIGPLAITPTISLIGLSLFKTGADMASTQWWIAITTIFLITIFSQYLRDVNVPWFTFGRGGCQRRGLPIFILFPVLLAMGISWGICAVLTVTDVLPSNATEWGHVARTDIEEDVLQKSQWFRFPYPGQWGLPTVSAASVFGMLAGVLASMIESVGDYYACARLSGAPPPPTHAVNRGIGIEGIGCILAGAWGSGNGTTSYSENIGAIGVTKVGSVRVVQVGGIVMLLLGCFGKFGALFATIPAPVVGGMFMVTFGMVTAVGLSNLQYVDLNSSRNIFILGLSLFFGLSAPFWVANNPTAIDTGSTVADQIFSVLLSTSMFVGGFIGFVLDNTIPGTPKERGLLDWRKLSTGTAESQNTRMHIYDLPLIQPYLDNISCLKYMPFCPNFMNKGDKYQKKEENGVEMNGDNIKSGIDNTAIVLDDEHELNAHL
ncbi:solute carrier family 23 member 1-like [Mya arenaria]|uniref:solute carrier family 23 member 1-like n=1 Tax=Mya arenaria TaxID=6604 RepID=UPI0022E3DDB4|nr:solute carrier family 23 member 1-like [Mya arenaria]